MWIRFLLVSLVRWIANMLLVSALLKYAIPSEWSGLATAACLWAVSFFLAFGLAEWAFAKRLPGKKEIGSVVLCWLVVGLSLDVLFAYFVLGSALVMIQSSDRLYTYAFEIAAILLAAYVTRHRKISATLGEGMEA